MDELPAFPEGWYFVASRESILRKQLIEKTWLGEEIVAWCDKAGRVCVADAVCPHLGSYLGPAAEYATVVSSVRFTGLRTIRPANA